MPKDTINAELAGLHQDAAGAHTAAIVTETAVPNTNSRGKTLRAQTAKRAGKAAGLSLIALSLAACGGSSSSDDTVEEATVYTLSDLITAMASNDVDEDFEVNVQAGDIGTFTVAEVSALLETIEGAQNGEAALTALNAAIAGGTVTWSIADSAANLLSFAGEHADVLESAASVSVTDSALSLTVTNFETLADFGVTYDGDVTVSDTAEAILASDADFGDAEIAVTTLADPLTVAELGTLNGLGATFAAAPDVADTIENADGATIAGIGNLTLGVAGLTPGADLDLEATITASGTGTVTFNFADEDDIVTLLAGSTFSGFTALAVVAGTVDVTAADLGDIVDITVASKIVMTAAQFLGLDSLDGLSDDAELEIEIASAEEAAAVLAAADIVNQTLRSGNVTLSLADNADVTVGELANFQTQLQAAFDTATANDELPNAIEALEAAADAIEAAAEPLSDQLSDITGDNYDITVDLGLWQTPLTTAVASAMITVEGYRDAGIYNNMIATLGRTDAQIAADVAVARTGIDNALDAAREAVADARQDLVNAETEVRVAKYIEARADESAAQAAFVEADTEQSDALEAALVAGGNSPVDWSVINAGGIVEISYYDVVGAQTYDTTIAAIDANGVMQILGSFVALSGDTYTFAGFNGNVSVPKAEFDALIAAAQEVHDANLDLVDAQSAVLVAQAAFTNGGATLIPAYDSAEMTLHAYEAYDAGFEAAYEAWEALSDDLAQLATLAEDAAALEANFVTALESIENATNAADAGLGVNVVGLGAVLGDTSGSDLFFAPTAGGILNIDGVDYVRFDESYTFIELGENDVMTDAQGSASTLEIFAEEITGGVRLYVEDIPTAGNGGTVSDLTTITLTGATLADLSYNQDTSILTASSTIV
jgi:hypothetical protein